MTMILPDWLVLPQARKIVAGQVFQANVEATAALPGAILNPDIWANSNRPPQQEGDRKMESDDGKVWLRQDYQRHSAAHRRV